MSWNEFAHAVAVSLCDLLVLVGGFAVWITAAVWISRLIGAVKVSQQTFNRVCSGLVFGPALMASWSSQLCLRMRFCTEPLSSKRSVPAPGTVASAWWITGVF